MPTYVKDSQQVINKTKSPVLPLNILFFSADVISIYNNTDTRHAIKAISWWVDNIKSKNKPLPNFPLEPVNIAMKTIVRNNIFESGDMYFLQLPGTAMGTSLTVKWAILFFASNKVHQLTPRHKGYLFYFKCFSNDIFYFWTGNTTTNWQSFCYDVHNFGIFT